MKETIAIQKIGDICEVLNGYAFKSENYVDSGIRIIRIANVQKGYIEDLAPVYYPIETTNLERFMLEKDDLLLSLTGNVGRVALLKEEFLPAALNQRVACLRIKPNADVYRPYLFHYLNSNKFEMDCIRAAKGIAQKNLSTEWLKEYEIRFFSLQKQKDIVKKLDTLDAIIARRKQQLDKLDVLIKSQFLEQFGDPVENPMGWEKKSLLDMGDCKNGINFRTNDEGIEIHCLGVGDFKNLSSIENTKNLPLVALNSFPSEEYLLRDGDIVFVRSNGNKALVGRCLVVYPKEIPTIYSGFCIRYRLTSNLINLNYLLRVLKMESIRKKMVGRGANIQNLNQKILATITIPLPPLPLQNQFAEFVQKVDKLKLDIQQALEETQTLYDSLMQTYFGE